MTVVGTPYYMSPEACQSAPYTAKSDVWSLGILLYELCTLQHAFSADNLLGLVFKIVSEDFEPIPNRYSPELQSLIKRLLDKKPENRPSIREILKMDLIRQKAIEFSKETSIQRSKTQVFVKNVPKVVPRKAPEEDNLTPAQRMKLNKEREAQKRADLMKQGAINAVQNYSYA